jgi:hypothetical protein
MPQTQQPNAKGDKALKPVQKSTEELPIVVYAPESRLEISVLNTVNHC